jgi:hypothetical protein
MHALHRRKYDRVTPTRRNGEKKVSEKDARSERRFAL